MRHFDAILPSPTQIRGGSKPPEEFEVQAAALNLKPCAEQTIPGPSFVSSPVEVQLQHLVTLALTENWPARGTIVRKQLFLSNFDSCYKQSWQKLFSLLDFDNYYKYPVMTPSCSSSWTTPSTAVWPLFETWDHEMMSRSKYSNHSINRSINQFLFRPHQKRHARQAHLLQIYFRFTTAD